jgi:eukaryotic-like serine/threonine-protein kinase
MSCAVPLIPQIGAALAEVHKHELAHRDVKPQNIMLRAGKSDAVLIDFGLIQKFDNPLTNVKPSSGSDGFAPLEMYLSNRPCGAYTDIYTLAATLYYLLVGKLPPKALDRNDPNILAPLQPILPNPQEDSRPALEST